jgi:hypothetical protein
MIFVDLACLIAAGSLATWAKDHDHGWLVVPSDIVAIVFTIPIAAVGAWAMIRGAVVDPIRAFLIRRNTGMNVYVRDGTPHLRPRHRRRERSG